MKQVLIKKGNAVVGETPVPPVSSGNVLVKVAYSLVSTGTEMAGIQRSGASLFQRVIANPNNIKKVIGLAEKQGIGRTAEAVKRQTTSETATGYSCSGKIVKTGKGISDLYVGDLVACAGAGKAYHAEYVSVPRNLTAKIPEKCSVEDAASVTLGAIAMQGVRRSGVSLGETVAVIGLGLIGQITCQLLRAAGCAVAGIDIDDSRIHLAQTLGMKFGVNPLMEDPIAFVRNITAGLGADAVIITADSKENAIIQQAMEITRKKGKVVIVGSVGLGLKRKPFYEKELDLLISCSYGPGRYDPSYEEGGTDYPPAYVRWAENRNMQAYLTLIADKKMDFKSLVQTRYAIDAAPEAFESLKASEKRPLAVLLTYPEQGSSEKSSSQLVHLNSRPISDRIQVGIIGCGSFAVGMHLPNLKLLKKQYSIHTLSGRDGAKLRNIGKLYDAVKITTDYRRVIEDSDLDMVLVCTRHNLHAQMIREALAAGKAVFVEKPLATTEPDFVGLKSYIEENKDKVKLMVGFNRRFSPAAKRAKEILAKRSNPAIIIYRVNAGYIPLEHWVHTEEGGGRIVGEACHMLDLFRYIIGYKAESVDVSAVNPSTSHVSSRDNVIATVKYTDGSLGNLIYSSLGNKAVEKETIEILCDNKILTIHDFKTLEIKGSREKGWSEKNADKGHVAELVEFDKYIKDLSGPPIPFDEIMETTELSFLIDKMAKNGEIDAG